VTDALVAVLGASLAQLHAARRVTHARKLWGMCAQCMLGASTAAAGVTGMRAWLAAMGFSWMTPRRLRLFTVSLIAAGLIGASVGISGP
jgi:hypothetical protein